jgi:hypothetical protein
LIAIISGGISVFLGLLLLALPRNRPPGGDSLDVPRDAAMSRPSAAS